MQKIKEYSVAIYTTPSTGEHPDFPKGETADRVEVMTNGEMYAWRKASPGNYIRVEGPFGWLLESEKGYDSVADAVASFQEQHEARGRKAI